MAAAVLGMRRRRVGVDRVTCEEGRGPAWPYGREEGLTRQSVPHLYVRELFLVGIKAYCSEEIGKAKPRRLYFLNNASLSSPLSPSPPDPFLALLNVETPRKCKHNFGLELFCRVGHL